MSGRLSASYFVRHASSVTEQQRLQQMIDELRRMRERCEPKSNQNPPVPPLLQCRIRVAMDHRRLGDGTSAKPRWVVKRVRRTPSAPGSVVHVLSAADVRM